ncbi:MAG: type IV secretory system conjugative DNA transfer family protein [Motilibacteraceae bacterium]
MTTEATTAAPARRTFLIGTARPAGLIGRKRETGELVVRFGAVLRHLANSDGFVRRLQLIARLAGWQQPLRWAPHRGCEDPLVAILRARAVSAGARVGVGVENGDFWSGMSQAVLRCYLHAAALDGRDARTLLAWASNPNDREPVRILRLATDAADGWADELEEQTEADPRQRGSVWAGVRRALDSLADPRVLQACSPGPGESLDPEEFLRQRGTLYLLGSSGAQLSVAPLITALIEDVTEHARRLAAASPGGRLDPPLLLVLDEVANVAPLPSLPSLLSDGGGVGIPTIAVLQSLAQARARWGAAQADAMWDASTIKVVLGGLAQADDLAQIARLTDDPRRHRSERAQERYDQHRLTAARLRTLPFGEAVLLHRATAPVRVRLPRPTVGV